jgi:hypothetical protein
MFCQKLNFGSFLELIHKFWMSQSVENTKKIKFRLIEAFGQCFLLKEEPD